jgi:hypothetical protein
MEMTMSGYSIARDCDEIDVPGYRLSVITITQQEHTELDDRAERLQPIAH